MIIGGIDPQLKRPIQLRVPTEFYINSIRVIRGQFFCPTGCVPTYGRNYLRSVVTRVTYDEYIVLYGYFFRIIREIGSFSTRSPFNTKYQFRTRLVRRTRLIVENRFITELGRYVLLIYLKRIENVLPRRIECVGQIR